jgi:hypothetical protein
MGVAHGIGPEATTRVVVQEPQHLCGNASALADANEEADERAFDDWTQSHALDTGQPSRHTGMVLVLFHGESDEHVRVEQVGRHSSSRAAATSSDVRRRPTLSTGKPDVASVRTTTGSSS